MSEASPTAHSNPKWRYALPVVSVVVALTLYFFVIAPTRDQNIDAVLRFIGFIDTAYTPGFTWSAFRHIKPGDSKDQVLATLGNPVVESPDYWLTLTFPNIPSETEARFRFDKDGGLIRVDATGGHNEFVNSINSLETEEEVLRRFGEPNSSQQTGPEQTWIYTYSPRSSHFWMCIVTIDRESNAVISTRSEIHFVR